jgi:tetratricopeptide (TPR) repeat protein
LLQRAIEIDPFNAEGFCLLAFTHLMQVQFGWTESVDKSIQEAAKAAENAVRIDDRDAWAHTALGMVDLISRRHDDAIQRLRRAVQLNPSLANAYGALGQALTLAGECTEAAEQIKKAIRLSPHDPFLVYWFAHISMAAFAEERYDVAYQWGAKVLQENPSFPGGHRLMAAIYGQLGRIEEAQAALKELLLLMPGMTIEDVRKQVPFKDPNHMERYLDGLRKAGLK